MDKMVAADFGYFMSLNPKAPEHFSRYADKQMRKIRGLNHKDKAVKEVNAILDEAFFFLRYIGDKDILEYFLRRYLANRVLFMSSSPNNIECEKGLIKRIEVYNKICKLRLPSWSFYYLSILFCKLFFLQGPIWESVHRKREFYDKRHIIGRVCSWGTSVLWLS